MEAVFLKIVNMSISAVWIVAAVLLLRLILGKAPKGFRVFMWGLVALRLIFPFSVESVLSLIPSSEPIPENIMMAPTPEINSGIPVINEVVNPIIQDSFTPHAGDSVNPLQVVITVSSYMWAVGIAAMLAYAAISYIRLYSKVSVYICLKDNIYICDDIETPFILGVIKPKIYLPSGMDEKQMRYVIAHEKAHIKRKDHLWKPLGYLLLTIYWFNPAIWLAYILLCRDIELACDEKVIKNMGIGEKKQYSQTLVACSVSRRKIAVCLLAFGEVGVKNRIKSVLNYKKPAFWIIILAVIASIGLIVGFLTSPKDKIEALPTETEAETENSYISIYIESIKKSEVPQLYKVFGCVIYGLDIEVNIE